MEQLLQISSAKLQRILTLKKQIESLEAQLVRLVGEDAPAAANAPVKQRTMSTAGRRAISLAAKARWAKIKAAQKK